jgi:hypothetical protein
LRVTAFALVIAVFAVAARADTGAGDLQPEVRVLLDAWLAAQNRGDFAAYEKLYAHKFTGVRRSGTRAVSLDRAGWMRERQRMFQKPMKVTASETKIGATPASARVTFMQEWESGSYHDRGPKQLVVVREEGVARIAREEMLSSEKSATAAATADGFLFVVGRYAILDADRGEEWATGATRLDDESDPVITSKRAAGVPPELAAFVGKKLVVQAPGAEGCTATVKELRVVGLVVPHFGMRQDWRDQHRSARQRADEAWELSSKVLGAALEGCTPTTEPTFARAATLPPLPLALSAKETALRAAAIAGLRKLPSWRALQKDYVEEGGKGKWDVDAIDAAVDVERWELPGGPLVTASAHAAAGCGDFTGEVFAVFRPRPDGSLAFVAEPAALRPGAALVIDGAPAFFGTQSWGDFGTAVQLVPVTGEPRKISVPYLDCPC